MDNKLILIVDDDPAFREIGTVKLQSAGFRVETAEDGEKGISAIQSLHPDLVLLDMKMPGLSGADTLVKIKETPELSATKVMFLSSLGDPEMKNLDDQYAKQLGALGYIRKGDDLDDLVKAVQNSTTTP